MPTPPPSPDSPTGLPAGALHPEYGNPTASHPDVTPATRDEFASLSAVFATALHQPGADATAAETPGKRDTDDVALTNLPIVRARDLAEGLLMYDPFQEPRDTVWTVTGLPQDVNSEFHQRQISCDRVSLSNDPHRTAVQQINPIVEKVAIQGETLQRRFTFVR